MSLYRWKLKEQDVVFEMWYDKPNLSNVKGYLLFCYGCPSHPFDHNPAITQSLVKIGYVLVYLRYLGTWESDGICTLENAVDSVGIVINSLKKESGIDIRNDKKVQWKYKAPILVGGSFGGSVVLVAGAKFKEVSIIISLAPVINFKEHGNGSYEEENLQETWNALEKGWKHLWRVKKQDWQKLMRGGIDLNPSDYVKSLQEKNVLLIHGKNDKAVHFSRSEFFFKLIDNKKSQFLLLEDKEHLGNYECGQEPIKSRLLAWLDSLGAW